MNIFGAGLDPAFLQGGTSSFTEFVAALAPDRLPMAAAQASTHLAPHGTTIVAATFAGGVMMAGDRRATLLLRL